MTGTVFLEEGELSVGEAAGVVRVPVLRTNDTSGAVTVEYEITGNTATTGSDFVAATGTVTIPASETRVTIDVPILDDGLSEATETFSVTLINVDSGALLAPRTTQVGILDNENPVVGPPNPPLVSDYDVDQTDVVTSLTQPIDFEFSPTNPSRTYIAEKGGVVKVANTETGEVSTFMDISDQVNDRQDRGLLDIALDPNFPDNPYIYAFYVVDPPETANLSGDAGQDGGGNRFSYVARFEVDASNDFLTVVPGSETILVGGAGQSITDISGNGAVDSTSNRTQPESGVDLETGEFIDDYLKIDPRSHAGGALAFGPMVRSTYRPVTARHSITLISARSACRTLTASAVKSFGSIQRPVTASPTTHLSKLAKISAPTARRSISSVCGTRFRWASTPMASRSSRTPAGAIGKKSMSEDRARILVGRSTKVATTVSSSKNVTIGTSRKHKRSTPLSRLAKSP